MGLPPANLELESIKCLFGEIDDLQSQVLLQISRISKRSSSDDTEPVQIFREKTVKTTTTLIHKIADLLRVTDLKILRIPAIAASEHYLHETLDLYNGKVKHLRRKLKESQLAAYRMENDVVHQQRLREYCPAKNLEGSDPTEPVDAKQALFEGRSAKHEGQRGNDKTKSVDEQILTQNKNISSSLQHSKQLMTMLVMQTELNIDTLDQQSKDLMQLNDKLIDMETVLTKSREIIKFIERQDKHDKRRIYAAILFLLLCSAWVLWRRVLKVPVKMLVWTLLKMFGVVSWATSVTTRDQPIGGLSEKTPLLAHKPSPIDNDHIILCSINTEEKVSYPESVSSSIGTLVLETESSSKEPAAAISSSRSSLEEPSGLTKEFVPESRKEKLVLTWEGTFPEATHTPDLSPVLDELNLVSAVEILEILLEIGTASRTSKMSMDGQLSMEPSREKNHDEPVVMSKDEDAINNETSKEASQSEDHQESGVLLIDKAQEGFENAERNLLGKLNSDEALETKDVPDIDNSYVKVEAVSDANLETKTQKDKESVLIYEPDPESDYGANQPLASQYAQTESLNIDEQPVTLNHKDEAEGLLVESIQFGDHQDESSLQVEIADMHLSEAIETQPILFPKTEETSQYTRLHHDEL